jgi:tripartite-type tricarboxylate transporter receptor subunit TctC
LAELGYPDANLDSLFGLFAPAGVSSELVQKMHRAVVTALAHPSLRDKLLKMNNIPFDGSAADFARLVAREALIR